MRIQHNIMAMNAYRNYTSNVSAMQKNLEKLSSGYKINRAGDDAAGLAISEKMRAQITGLETAQKNAKDGISLVQTAEGAMTEVHDMLNRMVELATQSANGTYDNDVDRAQMQKEMDQLNAEINRIADSANFNGIKLMDGSMDGEIKKIVGEPSFGPLQNISITDMMKGTGKTEDVHKEAVAGGKTSFNVDFDGWGITGVTPGNNVTASFNLWGYEDPAGTTDGAEKDVTKTASVTMTADKDGKVSSEKMAKAVYDRIAELAKAAGKDKVVINIAINGAGEDTAAPGGIKEIEYEVSMGADGKTLKFEMTDDGYANAVKYYNAANKVTAPATTVPELGTTAPNAAFRGGFTFNMQSLSEGTKVGTWRVGTTEVKIGGVESGEKLARAVTTDLNIKDGAGIKVGDQYYVWAGSDETMEAELGDNVHKIDIRDLMDPTDGTFKTGGNDGTKDYSKNLTEALSRLTVAAKDNEMFDVALNGDNQVITFTEKTSYSGDADLSTHEAINKQLQKFNFVNENVTTKPATGKSLTLQIGDTAESFNQLKVNIGDMHASALGLDKISIADQDSAAKAVDVIKDAINQVSDVRGTLGATQNRLDHTMNNLSVMQENIQDAESTIRDVDVAEEMMAYTKNNILIQSAQAMLAQANQVPQGVLQLLG